MPPVLVIPCPQCGTPSEYPSHLIGQSGPCRSCGASVTVDPRAAVSPPAAPPPPPTPVEVAPNKVQAAVAKNVEKEAGKAGHQVLGVKTLQISQDVTTGENVGQMLKARFMFGGKLRTDRVQAAKIQSPKGQYFLVIPYSGNVKLPHEYVSILPGNLPSSVWLTRGLMGSWSSGRWSGSINGEQDPTAALADKNYKLNDGIEWDWESGRTRIKLGWGMQVVPLRPGLVMHHVKTAERGIIVKDYGLRWYLDRQTAFAEFAAQFPPSTEKPSYTSEPIALLFLEEILATAPA